MKNVAQLKMKKIQPPMQKKMKKKRMIKKKNLMNMKYSNNQSKKIISQILKNQSQKISLRLKKRCNPIKVSI